MRSSAIKKPNIYTALFTSARKAVPVFVAEAQPAVTNTAPAIEDLHKTPQDFFTDQIEKSLQESRFSNIQVNQGNLKFKSFLLEGPSGAGLSSILLGHAFDQAGLEKPPVIYFVDNKNQYKYFQALVSNIKGSQDREDFRFISANENGNLNIQTHTNRKPQPKIYFVTRNALQDNLVDLQTLVRTLGIKHFYYDDINSLKYQPNPSKLCALMADTPAQAGLPCLIGSINFPFKPDLHSDFYYGTQNTLGQLFPGQYRLGLSNTVEDRERFGLTTVFNFMDKVIAFPDIKSDGPDSGLVTVARILRKEIPDSDIYIDRIADRLATLPGRTIVRTGSPKAARNIAEALKSKLSENLQRRVKVLSNTSLSLDHKWFEPESEPKFLITTNYFDQIHLPKGSFDNYAYLDAPTSSTALARDLSIATSDPQVQILCLGPKNAEQHHTYKFPHVENYEPIKPTLSIRKVGDKTSIPPLHMQVIEEVLKEAHVKDRRVWPGKLLPQLGEVIGETHRNIKQWTIVKSFINSHNDSGLSEAQILAVIKGDSYNPVLFRKFLDSLFKDSEGIATKLHTWYKDLPTQSRDTFNMETGLADLSIDEIKKAYPTLTGVFNLQEAQAVLSKFSPIHDFHLNTMQGFNIPARFTKRAKLEVLLSFLQYLKIDREQLIKDLGLDNQKTQNAIANYLKPIGVIEPAKLAKVIINYQLLAKLFPKFVINEDVFLKVGEHTYRFNFAIIKELNEDGKLQQRVRFDCKREKETI